MSIFCRLLGHLHLWEDKSVDPYDYIKCRESYNKKVGRCIGSAWVTEQKQPSMKVVTVKFGGSRGSGWA